MSRSIAAASVQAGQADPSTVLVPPLPEIVARTSIAAPLLPLRAANALRRTGVRMLGELSGWRFADFLIDGLGTASIAETIHVLETLRVAPANRLARLSRGEPFTVPNLPIEVIVALMHAKSVDDEIRALLADLDERNRALILARWGYGAHGARTLEDVGAAFGITRERARQIVATKESQLAASGVRLPLASTLVNDLDEAGGALPDADYHVLLRYGQVAVSAAAIRMLPQLFALGLVPEIGYDKATRLWMTRSGRARVDERDDVRKLATAARARAARYLRRLGAVPLRVVDGLSPFGREHAVSLLEVNGAEFVLLSGFALRLPMRDSRLLRQIRKAVVATGGLDVSELLPGLRASGLSIDHSLLEAVLDRSPDLVTTGSRVRASAGLDRDLVLSPAESAGLELIEAHGGAMSWWDFIDGMKATGFSAPMAALVLRKPWMKRLGPAMYGLRGRDHDPGTVARLDGHRKRQMRRRVIQRKSITETGVVLVTYRLNRFALQGVLPVPAEVSRAGGRWSAVLRDGRTVRTKVSKGFMWPLQTLMSRVHLEPGDELEVRFDLPKRIARLERTGRHSREREVMQPSSREEQILRALFGDDL